MNSDRPATAPVAASRASARLDLSERRVPALGGFNTTLLRLEIRRLLRNRRTVIFTFLLPGLFYLLFGLGIAESDQDLGPGTHGNVSAYIMVSMALYGGMLATTSGGAAVSVERASGWSRQLRLTPLAPSAYVAIKLIVAMLLGLGSVVVVYLLGLFTKAHMDTSTWITTGAIVWVGSLVFAAFGLFMGYLLPSENVMQILGPVLAILAAAGGLFSAPVDPNSLFGRISAFMPTSGLNGLVHAPLTGEPVQLRWILNVVAWFVVFAVGAGWRFRRDTARV